MSVDKKAPFTEPPISDPRYEALVEDIKAALELEKDYEADQRTVNKYALRPTDRLVDEEMERTFRIHVKTCLVFSISIAENWRFFTPCSCAEAFGQYDDDERIDIAWLRARKRPPAERLDYMNWAILDAPDAPGPDLLRKIYGCKRLSGKQYHALRQLWVVDSIRSPQELVREACILRPYQFAGRWRGGNELDEMKRYTGDWRVELVTKVLHAYSEVRMARQRNRSLRY